MGEELGRIRESRGSGFVSEGKGVRRSRRGLRIWELSELRIGVELRFDEDHLVYTFYTQFTSRKQDYGDDLPTLGADLERLA